jgi:hypothetical protein
MAIITAANENAIAAAYPIDISENECRDVAMQRLYKGFR